jgi:dolichol-phosphate mannosyltransferase
MDDTRLSGPPRHSLRPASSTLVVVAPVYNEVEGIEHFVGALLDVMDRQPYAYSLVLVDDGGTDGSGAALDAVQQRHPDRITVLHLSRNFGHQAALTAGMDHADGDAVICLDADMQHPPELIPQLIARWEEGYEIVQATRREEPTASWFKQTTARLFYALINRLSATRIEPNAADFRLLSRRVVEVFKQDLRERDRFVRGLVRWVGFSYCTVDFEAPPRFAGHTHYSLRRMVSFARTGLISFSKAPLKVAVVLGFTVSALSLLYGVYAIFAYLFFSAVIPGWASTVLVGTFLGGCQLLFLGLIGEYIATIFDEIKARPLYIVATMRPAVRGAQRRALGFAGSSHDAPPEGGAPSPPGGGDGEIVERAVSPASTATDKRR